MRLPARSDSGTIQQVRIDVGTLKDFGKFLHRELESSIGPMTAHVTRELVEGGDIGPSFPSDDLQLMNAQHAECVATMKAQLEALKIGMAIIADAAQTIAARYSASDILAHTTIQNIAPSLNSAVVHDTPPNGSL